MNNIVPILQARELKILNELSVLFGKHNIPFCLAYGTTLGCIRHKGFIPWDDDIDIFVWGEDLPRIKQLFREEDTGFLKLHDYDTVDNYPYCFPKVVDDRTSLKEEEFKSLNYMCGVYVDIFPLFEVSDNLLVRKFSENIRHLKYGLLRYYYMDTSDSGIVQKILNKISRVFCSATKLQTSLYKTYIHKSKGCRLVAEPNIFASKALVPKLLFENLVNMPFESGEYPVPSDYKTYLTLVYGDYMQLPPVEKRVSEHKMIGVVIDGTPIM